MINSKYLLWSLLLVSISSIGAESDLDWYLGTSVGYTRSKLDTNTFTPFIPPGFSATTYWANTVNSTNVSASGSESSSSADFNGGIFTGFNSRFADNGIWGAEAGWLAFSADKTTTNRTIYPGPFTSLIPRTTISMKQNNIGYLAGKLGISKDDISIYAKTGIAVTKLEFNLNFNDNSASASNSESGYELGWIAGVGLEKSLESGWSIRAEYLRADFGSITNTSNNMRDSTRNYTRTTFKTNFDAKNDLLNIGIIKSF